MQTTVIEHKEPADPLVGGEDGEGSRKALDEC